MDKFAICRKIREYCEVNNISKLHTDNILSLAGQIQIETRPWGGCPRCEVRDRREEEWQERLSNEKHFGD